MQAIRQDTKLKIRFLTDEQRQQLQQSSPSGGRGRVQKNQWMTNAKKLRWGNSLCLAVQQMDVSSHRASPNANNSWDTKNKMDTDGWTKQQLQELRQQKQQDRQQQQS